MELRLLGPVRAQVGDEVLPLGPRQQRLALAVLALEVNRPISVDRLVRWIWPDHPPRSAPHAVRVQISNLRSILAGCDVEITTEGGAYLLRADPLTVDVHRFLDGVARARAAPNDRARVALLDQAIDLWTGPTLADTITPDVRDRLCGGIEESRLLALEDRFDAMLRLGEHHQILGAVTDLAEGYPTRERLVGQLMLALHRTGQSGKALDVAQRTRALLADELGIDPGAELRRLELGILREDKALDAPVDAAVTIIPEPRNRLIGRGPDVTALVDHLATTRLLTLTGPGGVGKTRLAMEAARRMSAHVADGVTVVSLGPVRDPNLVLATIAGSLTIRDTAGVPLRTTLQVHLRDRQLLLVLDNMEHLLDAVGDVGWLLDAVQGLTVLVTSRSPLRLTGERLRPVEPLDSHAAAELFTERAEQAGANDLEPDAVAAICERLDGLPLAIELAAARTRLLSPSALRDQLMRSYDLLSDGARDLPIRHQALSATMRWSYDLLTGEERRMLHAVAVFEGGATLPAITAVAGVEPLRLLGALLDASLITRQDDRFAMLETIRVFALAQADLPELRERHAAWVEQFLADARHGVEGPDPREWFDRLVREQGNLRAAMRWMLDRGQHERCAAALVFLRYWIICGKLGEYRQWALQVLAGELSVGARARVLGLYGFAVFGTDRAEGDRVTDEAVRLARQTGDPRVLAPTLLMRAHVAMWLERDDVAAAAFAEAEEPFRQLGSAPILAAVRAAWTAVAAPEDAAQVLAELEAERREAGGTWDLGVTLIYLGLALIRRGDWDRAERVVLDAIASLHQFGAGAMMMYALNYLSVTAAHTGRHRRSARLAGAAAVLVEQFGPSMFEIAVTQLTRQATEIVRTELGSEVFDALYAEGRAMTFRQAVAMSRTQADEHAPPAG
ncbi:BTAD domain-containing putative transcriptional regulator [Kutzneria buriramensis]|uniref:Transcriptional regulator n=1 Tax=Kutzneria buriramensis TaxID=1045776 RepID=A0A3E0GTG0_9PSEU|nr:BTAD domain-containing putative transcriptional regulator [Kutzneria buriramensis]REH26210.1 transcriptional regulator [Kutzneria buriramensis]